MYFFFFSIYASAHRAERNTRERAIYARVGYLGSRLDASYSSLPAHAHVRVENQKTRSVFERLVGVGCEQHAA